MTPVAGELEGAGEGRGVRVHHALHLDRATRGDARHQPRARARGGRENAGLAIDTAFDLRLDGDEVGEADDSFYEVAAAKGRQ